MITNLSKINDIIDRSNIYYIIYDDYYAIYLYTEKYIHAGIDSQKCDIHINKSSFDSINGKDVSDVEWDGVEKYITNKYLSDVKI